MNLIKLYFTIAAIIVVAICSDPLFPDTAISITTWPVLRTDHSPGQLTHYSE